MPYPERLYNNGAEVAPSDVTRDNASSPESQLQIRTLQTWLACAHDYSRLPDGVWNAAMTKIVKSLFPDISGGMYFPQHAWNTLEEQMLFRTPAARKNSPKKKFSTVDASAVHTSLASIGIQINAAAELSAGLQLFQALAREVDHYLDVNADDSGQMQPVYADLLDANPVFTDTVWKNFDRHWGLFYGAPWLGVVAEVPSPLKAPEVLWCNASLFEILHRWGRAYQVCMQEKGLLEEALRFPIVIRYTGNRLGGQVASRRDFSQIGMNAAVSLENQNDERLATILDALAIVDPAMRLRVNREVKISKANLVQNPSMRNSSVLEYDPLQQRILRRPELIAAWLRTMPDYFDHYSLDRFARGVAAHAHFLKTDDLEKIFTSIRDLSLEKLVFFLGRLRTYGALGPILNRIELEEKDFLEVILSVKLPDIGGEAIDRVKEGLKKFQRYLVDAYQLADQLRDVGFAAATTTARDMVSHILKENIPV